MHGRSLDSSSDASGIFFAPRYSRYRISFLPMWRTLHILEWFRVERTPSLSSTSLNGHFNSMAVTAFIFVLAIDVNHTSLSVLKLISNFNLFVFLAVSVPPQFFILLDWHVYKYLDISYHWNITSLNYVIRHLDSILLCFNFVKSAPYQLNWFYQDVNEI